MRIIDLTKDYQSKYIRGRNRAEYENSFPEFFHHYYRFWAHRERDLAILTDDKLHTRMTWINESIEQLNKALEKIDIDAGSIEFVYIVGTGSTNGHAFRLNDRFYVWLPLETYTSAKLATVFAAHETIHALHYQASPSFYFGSEDEQIQISRQLVTEGLATYVTKKILAISDIDALWADYLDDSAALKWWEKCQAEEPNLLGLVHKNYYTSSRELGIFYASNPDDIYRFRSGYYAGLKLIELYAKTSQLTLRRLLELPRDRFEKDILELIRSLIS